MAASKFSSWWASLTPDRRRAVMGVGSLVILLGVVYLFVTATPKKDISHDRGGRVDTNLLTGSDARTLGIEALGAELRASESAQRALQSRIDKLEQQSPNKKDLEGIAQSVASLGQGLESIRKDGARGADAQTARPLGVGPETVTRGSPTPESSAPLGSPVTNGVPSDPLGHGTPVSNRSTAPAEILKIRVFGESATPAATAPSTGKVTPASGDLYLPAGSILHGVLLNGVDAPTGMQSKRDPIPTLMRVKSEALLPNRFRADVRECFVILGATGELSTERALMRAETLSCVRKDGGVLEATIDAYTTGDDGKTGLRGRLVKRNGSLVAAAAFSSFAEALSQVFRPVAIQGFSTTPGSTTQFQAPNPSDAFQAAGYAGFGGAMAKLSDYFVKMADQMVPFVEVDAARPLEAILLKGVTLQMKGKSS